MDDNLQELRRDIEQTRTALGNKISLLEGKIETAKKTTFNPAYHVRTRPGAALGVSVALGWLLGRVVRAQPDSEWSHDGARQSPAREWARSAGTATAKRTGVLAGALLAHFLRDRLRKYYDWL